MNVMIYVFLLVESRLNQSLVIVHQRRVVTSETSDTAFTAKPYELTG